PPRALPSFPTRRSSDRRRGTITVHVSLPGHRRRTCSTTARAAASPAPPAARRADTTRIRCATGGCGPGAGPGASVSATVRPYAVIGDREGSLDPAAPAAPAVASAALRSAPSRSRQVTTVADPADRAAWRRIRYRPCG